MLFAINGQCTPSKRPGRIAPKNIGEKIYKSKPAMCRLRISLFFLMEAGICIPANNGFPYNNTALQRPWTDLCRRSQENRRPTQDLFVPQGIHRVYHGSLHGLETDGNQCHHERHSASCEEYPDRKIHPVRKSIQPLISSVPCNRNGDHE